jgi:hypothetical protein
MAFDTDQQTVYQIRSQHGNEQVRELIPGDYRGTLVTDRFSSYEAEELAVIISRVLRRQLGPKTT